jgi:hypothetical protein
MNDIFSTVGRLAAIFSELEIQFALIGGMALQVRGEPRVTRDIDLTVLVGLDLQLDFIEVLVERLPLRSGIGLDFCIENRILLTEFDGVPVDIGLGGFDFEVEMVSRSTIENLTDDVVAPVISAEDLIVMKVFAGRAKDWLDVRGILVRQHGKLDLGSVENRLMPLLELLEEPERLNQLAELIRSLADLE